MYRVCMSSVGVHSSGCSLSAFVRGTTKIKLQMVALLLAVGEIRNARLGQHHATHLTKPRGRKDHGAHPRLDCGRRVVEEVVPNPPFRIPAEGVERSVSGEQGHVRPCCLFFSCHVLSEPRQGGSGESRLGLAGGPSAHVSVGSCVRPSTTDQSIDHACECRWNK